MIKFQVTCCEWKGNTKCSTHTLKSTPVVFLIEPVIFPCIIKIKSLLKIFAAKNIQGHNCDSRAFRQS